MSPLVTKMIIDIALPARDFSLFLRLVSFASGIVIVSCAVRALRHIIRVRVEQAIGCRLRSEFYSHLHALPLSFFDNKPTGELMYRCSVDVDNVSALVVSSFPEAVFQLLRLAVTLAVLVYINSPIALGALAVVPIIYLKTFLLSEHRRNINSAIQEAQARITAVVQESLLGVKVVKAFCQEKAQADRYRGCVLQAMKLIFRNECVGIASDSVGTLLMTVWGAALSLIAGSLVIQGRLSLGTVVAAGMYINQALIPLEGLYRLYESVTVSLVSADRMVEVLDLPTESARSVPRVEVAPARFSATVQFEDVVFGYVQGLPVLRGVSFHADEGQMVALVGPCGAGKTTITNLVARFYDPWSGRIMVGGKDLRDHDLRQYRRWLGVVTQEPFLFDGTVEENLLWGAEQAAEETMVNMCRALHLHELIMMLPEGYLTRVGQGGSRLSPGQRQLVAIARALLRNPAILILDEPSAFLDSYTEKCVRDALSTVRAGRTTFVIAHRLSTVVDADMVLLIRDGSIIDRGTHPELLRRNAFYRRVYELQLDNWAEPTEDGLLETLAGQARTLRGSREGKPRAISRS